MDEPQVAAVEEPQVKMGFWTEHRYLLLIFGTVVISIILTSISLIIYNVSGAALLDLSRPGYQSVSSKVDRTSDIDSYSRSGPINKSTVDQFTKIYDAQATKVKAVDAFNGDPLNPEVLEFGTSGQ
jgi:hypothetical protein